MRSSLTLHGWTLPRFLSVLTGLGMVYASLLSIEHFFAANFPASIYEGSFCDLNAFFNCDSSAFSEISQLRGIPLGYFGVIAGALVALGALFPSAEFERSNKFLALFNAIGVVALLLYSVVWLKSLCLICSIYYVFSLASFFLFWKYGIDRQAPYFYQRYFRPSFKHLATYAVITLMGAYGMVLFHQTKREAQSGGVAARVVKQFYALEPVTLPSVISPFMAYQSTPNFEDAAIQVIEYSDFLCPDCRYLSEQLEKLKAEFAGKMNIAFQFFPLDAQCNEVVEKDKHPGACDLSYMAAYDPDKFVAIHDEIFENFEEARTASGRMALARKYQVEAALDDEETKMLVRSIINTGTEFEKTSDQYAHGIRSTPTMIVNGRMIIGTLPYEQLRAIFQALVDEHEGNTSSMYLENWVDS